MGEGFLLIISGPSGVGKGTILKKVEKNFNDLVYSISATTRKMRQGEKDGVDYFFKSVDQFNEMVEKGLLLEHAKVHNNYYGTPKKFVEDEIAKGNIVILEIDVQGAKTIMDNFSNVASIFLAPPSKEELRKRIINRHTDSPEDIELRLKNSLEEMECIKKYDYLVINDELERASEDITNIINAEKHRVKRSNFKIK